MSVVNPCKTCPQVKANIKIIRNLKEDFKSRKKIEAFEKPIVIIEAAKEIRKVSFNDLATDFTKDYPGWKENLVSVPSAGLISYVKKVPYCVTEDDVRNYLSGEFKDVLQKKRDDLNSLNIRQIVETVLKQFKTGKMTLIEASELLNERILDIVFIGENSKIDCKKCEKKLKCPNKRCPVKKGLKTKLDVARDHYQNQWKSLLQTVNTCEDVIEFSKQKLQENIKRYLSGTPEFSLLSSIRGQKTENSLASLLQSHLCETPGLLLCGYKVFSSLKNILKSYDIKLSKCLNDKTQVEHDIINIVPTETKVKMNFSQSKATIHLPWPHEADRAQNKTSACIKAFEQLSKDLETFGELSQHFLTREEFHKIEFNFNISITSLDEVLEQDICNTCRSYIHESEKTYNKTDIEKIFGIADVVKPSEEMLEIMKTLATLYVGGGSIVELKNSEDGYNEENKRLKHVEENMRQLFTNQNSDISEKYVAHNKIIQLGPDQNNIYMSGIGLNQSYALISPWGGGKSLLLELELRRVVEFYNETKETVKIYLVVYEMKATDLFKHYENLVCDLNRRGNVLIEVMNLKQICDLNSVKYKNRDTTSILNEICESLSDDRKDAPTYLFMDEIIVENPNSSSPLDLVGRAPFIIDEELFPWNNLNPYEVNLIACINPESQDLSQLQNLDSATIQKLKELKPDQGPVLTIPMWRVFRSSKSISSFVNQLQEECSNIHQEVGYHVPPNLVKEGHEIEGKLPIWIKIPEHQHMKCPKYNCKRCLLISIEESFDGVLLELYNEGIPDNDILIIVNSSALTKNCAGSFETEYLRSRHPNLKIRSNFEYDGCEAKVVVVIRNGGLISFALSNTITRAVSRLIIFSPDDNDILKKCCYKKLLVQKHILAVNFSKLSQENFEIQACDDNEESSMCYPASKATQTMNQNENKLEDLDGFLSQIMSNNKKRHASYSHASSTGWSTRTSSPTRLGFSITDESRSSSLISLDSGVDGTKTKPIIPPIEMKDGNNVLNPSVQKALAQVQAEYQMSANDAQGVLVQFANTIFGQNWEKEKFLVFKVDDEDLKK